MANSDVDTKDQVAASLRLFPNVISDTTERAGVYPIYRQLFKQNGRRGVGGEEVLSLKSIAFIPIMAELGIEYQQFAPHERGGLLKESIGGSASKWNMLQHLCRCFDGNNPSKKHDRDYHRMVDKKLCEVLEKLIKKDLFQKEDVLEQNLVGLLCSNYHAFFPTERFSLLCRLDPNALMTPCLPMIGDHLPIHYSVYRDDDSMEAFQINLRIGMDYFPDKLGFVFHIVNDKTPYEMACKKHGRQRVTDYIEKKVLAQRFHPKTSSWNDRSRTIIEKSIGSVILSLATDDDIRLDAVFLFLRHCNSVMDASSSNNNDNNNNNNNATAAAAAAAKTETDAMTNYIHDYLISDHLASYITTFIGSS